MISPDSRQKMSVTSWVPGDKPPRTAEATGFPQHKWTEPTLGSVSNSFSVQSRDEVHRLPEEGFTVPSRPGSNKQIELAELILTRPEEITLPQRPAPLDLLGCPARMKAMKSLQLLPGGPLLSLPIPAHHTCGISCPSGFLGCLSYSSVGGVYL